MAKLKCATKNQALRALQWGADHLGLHGWNISLYYTDNYPKWLSELGEVSGLGRVLTNSQYRSIKLWVSPKKCMDDGCDPLQCLFHELTHSAIANAGMEEIYPATEFFVDRIADAMLFGYYNKMKAWK